MHNIIYYACATSDASVSYYYYYNDYNDVLPILNANRIPRNHAVHYYIILPHCYIRLLRYNTVHHKILYVIPPVRRRQLFVIIFVPIYAHVIERSVPRWWTCSRCLQVVVRYGSGIWSVVSAGIMLYYNII